MLVSPLHIWNIPYKNFFKVTGTRHFTIPTNIYIILAQYIDSLIIN